MSEKIDVLAVMQASADQLWRYRRDILAREEEEARAAVAELVERAEQVIATLEMPTLARQSGKNENAGFIDWRDWCALKGEVAALRAAIARVQGGES